jgi:hypothetical protein
MDIIFSIISFFLGAFFGFVIRTLLRFAPSLNEYEPIGKENDTSQKKQ